jgi:nucleotide-binding universal stress UspA family protein
VIIGSKGQSESSAVLLGSTAAKVVREYPHAPILILKKKGENKSFLEVLFGNF